jgi:hypothetical protein
MSNPTYESELESLPEFEFEDELEGEDELESAGEFETEFECEGECETELNPVRKVYPDALMEHLGFMASEAETEQEAAEHFLPLIGLAAKKLLPVVAKAIAPAAKRLLPRIARAVTKVEPQLTRGVARIAKTLHRQPGTRPLLRALPAIARRTVHSVARQAALGHRVTPKTALRSLATQTRWILSRRPHRRQALRRSHTLDRRLHRHLGPGTVRPHGPVMGGRAPGAAMPGGAAAWTGWRAVSRGAMCPPCPRCGGPSAAPAYCGCCGQVLR